MASALPAGPAPEQPEVVIWTESRRIPVSVVIPVHNAAAFLHECLDSALAQTLAGIEIVAVNDGSTDASGAILDRYAVVHPNLKVIHQSQQGVSVARNAGIDVARGRYIAFLDADDLAMPEMYERLLAMATEVGADIVKCGFRSFGGGRPPVDVVPAVGQKVEVAGGIEAVKAHLAGRIETVCWDGIYSRRLFREVRFPVGRSHEDTHVMPRLLFHARKIVLIPQVLYLHRKWPGSFMASFSMDRLDELRARYELHALFSDVCGYAELRPGIDRLVAHTLARIVRQTVQRLQGLERRQVLAELQRILDSNGLVVRTLARGAGVSLKSRALLYAFSAGVPAVVLLDRILRPLDPWLIRRRRRRLQAPRLVADARSGRSVPGVRDTSQ